MTSVKLPEWLTGQQSAAATNQVSALLAASSAVNSALGVREALRVVLSSAKELLGAQEGSVMLLDENGYLRILASEGIAPEIISTTKIALGEGVAGKVAQSGRPILLTGQADEGAFSAFVRKDRYPKSAISVPLKAAGRTLGVLNLNITSGGRDFTPEDLALAHLFADHAAMATYKTQLLEESHVRAVDLALLFEASKELVGVLEMEPLLNRILEGAGKLVPARAGFLCLIDEADGSLSLGVYRGIARHEIRSMLARPELARVIGGEGAAVLSMAKDDVAYGHEMGNKRAIVLPTRAGGRSQALLVLISDVPSKGRLSLLEAFSSQAGLAIRNAQLYREVDEKETELASIVYSMRNPILVVDAAGRIVVANPAAEDLFGFLGEFVRGRDARGILGEPELENLLFGEGEGPVEVHVGDPTPRFWKARVSRITTPHSPVGGRIMVLEDVTAEREIEALRSDFVAMIGHELRTPLTPIRGFLSTLIRRGERLDEEQRRDALATIDAQVQRLGRLIENLLHVSRIEDSNTLHLDPTDLVDLTKRMINEFQVQQPQRSFNLNAPSELSLPLDRTKTEQVLFHLLDNACKYSEENAPVEVEVNEHDDAVEVNVIDRGMGILSGDLPRLFDRFHQLDLSSTRKHGGMGVGLFICKRFVEAQGGRMSVSSAWGKGSTFSFTLPKKSGAAAPPAARGPRPSGQLPKADWVPQTDSAEAS